MMSLYDAQGDSVKYTRKNDDVRPFEAGGDTNLEHFAQKTDSSLFVLGNHSKKRPHNIVLGRFFDHRLHDVLEFGVERFRGIKEFAKAATAVQIGNKVLHILQLLMLLSQYRMLPAAIMALTIVASNVFGIAVRPVSCAWNQLLSLVTIRVTSESNCLPVMCVMHPPVCMRPCNQSY